MRKVILLSLLICAVTASALAQETSKSWTDWSKKDAEKILNDSSWGQTFTVEPQENVSTRAITATNAPINNQGETGQKGPSKSMHWRARLLTAKPVREGFM